MACLACVACICPKHASINSSIIMSRISFPPKILLQANLSWIRPYKDIADHPTDIKPELLLLQDSQEPVNMVAARVVLVFIFLAMVLGLGCCLEFTEKDLSSDESLWDLYAKWRAHHTISRDLSEKQKRLNVFKSNAHYIHKVNQMGRPYKLELNKFADMTNHEFRNFYSSKIKHHRMFKGSSGSTGFMHERTDNVPPSVDWRKQGAVTAVKNQGNCGTFWTSFYARCGLISSPLSAYMLNLESLTGSCWAFSTIVGVEGINKIKTGQLLSLSEQELVDCDKVNEGCNGGLMENAYEFIKKQGGITTELAYPYGARDGIPIFRSSISLVRSPCISTPKRRPLHRSNLISQMAKQTLAVALILFAAVEMASASSSAAAAPASSGSGSLDADGAPVGGLVSPNPSAASAAEPSGIAGAIIVSGIVCSVFS